MCEAHHSGMKNFAELLRLITNLIRIGTIEQIDVDQARVRVKSGENITGWLPWLTRRAGATKDWNPPTIGEQIILLSPSGDLAQAIVLGSLYSDENPAPKNSNDLYHLVMPDGSFLTYNHIEHSLLIEVLGISELHITGNTKIIIDSDAHINITGNLNAEISGSTAIKSGGNLTLESSGNINITAGGNTNIKGSTVNLN